MIKTKKDNDLCASSGSVIPDGGVVYCVCGCLWKDQECVPMHDLNGHPQTAKKLKARIDCSWEVVRRQKAEMERREQQAHDEYIIAMIEIEKRKMLGRARRNIHTMAPR